MNFKDELNSRIELVEKTLGLYLTEHEGYIKTVLEAMRYSLLAGGKRLRPILMLESYRLFQPASQSALFQEENEDSKLLYTFMAAIEMIHSYSLVHDDMPCMDNDEYRRGRKTSHIVYGEGMALLAGSGLLNYAFEITSAAVMNAGNYERMQRGVKALHILSSRSGIYGMLGGQSVDIESSGQQIDRGKLDFIYKHKTGALIEASMLIGAVLSCAGEAEQELIHKAAMNIGLAFQIQDDILDVTGSLEVLGKVSHSDEKEMKTTYVTLDGIQMAKEKEKAISNEAMELLKELKYENAFLNELIHSLISRDK